MGLFKKLKKQNEIQIKQDNHDACANDNRRFTYVVEDAFQLLEQKGIVIVGRVHGTLKVDDAAYIMHPNGQITMTKVSGLESKINGRMEKMQEATDTFVSILFADIKDKTQIAKYSLVTSIRPQPTIDVNQAAENAYILGLANEYARFYEDIEYMSILTYQIAHGHYLAPISMNKTPQTDPQGKVVLTQDTQIMFPTLKDPSDQSKSVLPTFTDWKELSRWENLFDEQHPAQTMILTFQDCSSMAKAQHTGFVINPFSDSPVFVSNAMIASIENMEGYQKEFGQTNSDIMEEIKIEKDTQVMVGVPAISNEVTAIRNALRAYGERTDIIQEIYFLLKIDDQQEKTYLCIVNCPKENAHEIFHSLYEEIKPYAIDIPIIDFSLKEDFLHLEDDLKAQSIIYPYVS